MQPNPSERQERIDSEERTLTDSRSRASEPEDRTSPSGGWREVYAAMGVSASGDAEEQGTTRARLHTDETDSSPKPSKQIDSATANS